MVGWPPLRPSRMNSLVNQSKSPTSEDCNSTAEKSKNKSVALEKIGGGMSRSKDSMSKGLTKNSLFVKVNMDGIPIGRKVDLNVHNCYETLAQTLDDMFCSPSLNMNGRSEFLFSIYRISFHFFFGVLNYLLSYPETERIAKITN